ncbi:MAG: ribonuclease H-like YkuK family protein [Patescibacteria group bacterium]
MTEEIKFYNDTLKRRIGFDELIKEISKYVNEKPKSDYLITVGTDSAGVNDTELVTAITILRVGNGGKYFWTKSEKIFCPTLHDRIYKEAMQSITFTQELKSRLKDKLGEEYLWDNKITVHLDIGKNGPTRDFIDSVIGMVKGFGLEAAIKPYSYCASIVADRHT